MRYSSELNTSTLIYYRFQCFLFFFFVFLLSFPIPYILTYKFILLFLNEIYISCGCWLDFTVCYLNRYNNKMMPHYFDQLPVFDFCEWKILFFTRVYYVFLFVDWIEHLWYVHTFQLHSIKNINFYEKHLI